jgi:hypothetical protein
MLPSRHGGFSMLRLLILLALGIGLTGCGVVPVQENDTPIYCPKLGGRMPQC